MKPNDPSAIDLVERLVSLARQARTYAEQGQSLELAELLAQVREDAAQATGAALDLLEVAGAFLRALARSDMGKAEVALRRFALAQEDSGASFLGPLVDGGSITPAAVDALGPGGRELVDVGVLRQLPAGRYDLRPSLRAIARDLIEPAPFRLWRRVEAARRSAAANGLKEQPAAALLAGRLGVSEAQARQHLRGAPLHAVFADQRTIIPRERVVYQRPGTTIVEASAKDRPGEPFGTAESSQLFTAGMVRGQQLGEGWGLGEKGVSDGEATVYPPERVGKLRSALDGGIYN